jgi:hypothetical protein
MTSIKNTLTMFGNRLLASKNNALIHNKFVLYLIFIISLGNIFYLTMAGDVLTISLFALIGFITSFFTKNMVVILVIALTVSFVLKNGTDLTHENFDNSTSDVFNVNYSVIDTLPVATQPVPDVKKESDNKEK